MGLKRLSPVVNQVVTNVQIESYRPSSTTIFTADELCSDFI
jgi:hypothetical protein